MIQNEATKMVTLFSEQLEHKMKSFYENKNHFEFRYWVGSISISYNPYDDLWARSSAFRDYNVERLTDPYKVEGVAWALQKVAISQILQKYTSIVNSDIAFEACFVFPRCYVDAKLTFEIQLERFRTL